MALWARYLERVQTGFGHIEGDLADMRSEMLRDISGFALALVYPYLCVLMVRQGDFTLDLVPPVLVAAAAILAQTWRRQHLWRATGAFVMGLMAANLLIAGLYDFRWTPYVLPASMLLIGVLLDPTLMFTVAGATGLGLVALVVSHPRRAPLMPVLWPNLLALGLAAFSSWVAAHALYNALHRAWRSFVEARDQRGALRARQEQLGTALKALDEAADRLQHMNDELARAREVADEMRQLQQQFMANVSHELRTPLALITGFSETIYLSPESYGCPLPRAYVGDVREIYRSSRHLLGLIDDVLDLSQIRAGKMRLIREPSSVAEIIAEAVEVMRPLVSAKGLALEVAAAPDLPTLLVDPTRVRQVLLNLLNNARRFADEGHIRVSARQEGERVVVTVQDTGIGISNEDQGRIFQAFRQVDGSSSRRQDGVGLGLAISRNIVEMHGGSIWVESEGVPGRGSAFHFGLPVSDALPVDRAPLRHVPRRTSARDRLVVVHGGGQEMAAALGRRLKGYRTTYVEDAAQLARVVDERMPVAVLVNAEPQEQLDWLTGSGSPTAALGIPTVICALGREDQLARALDAQAYLTKPIHREALLATLEGIAGAHRVLVVDDDPGVLRLVARILQGASGGYEVTRVGSGGLALERLREEAFDAVLLDLLMPDMDGYQVLAEIRGDEALRDTPVIIITSRGHTEEDDRRYAGRFVAVTQMAGMSNDEAMLYIQSALDGIAEHPLLPPVTPRAERPLAPPTTGAA